MNGIEKLTGWATVDLKEAAYIGVGMMIEHYNDIDRISERFCHNRAEAFADIFEKGLQAMLDMCDMDDRLCETEDRLCETDEALMDSAPSMPNTPTGKGGSI